MSTFFLCVCVNIAAQKNMKQLSTILIKLTDKGQTWQCCALICSMQKSCEQLWVFRTYCQLKPEKLTNINYMVKRQLMSSIFINTFQFDDTTVPLSVKSIGFSSTAQSMENGICQTSKSYYYQLHWNSSVRKYISIEATVKLVISLLLPCLTTAILSFWVCLLFLSIAFIAYRTVLLGSYWKIMNLTPSLLRFNRSTGSQSHKEFSTR